MAGAARSLLIGAVGGTIINRQDPCSAVALTTKHLSRMDITFCQVDTTFSERGCPQGHVLSAQRAHPRNAEALRIFAVASFATNHCMDWGPEAFQDTLDTLKSIGLMVVGAGNTLAEARRPATVEVNGTRAAFLAYNSILPMGYAATAGRPGCAPLRAHTVYEPIEPDQPGTPCRIHTFIDWQDVQALKDDVAQAKSQADVVFVSLHAGIHIQPVVIPDYQREAAYAAIDAGADIVVGHHAHILKGVEVYRGKPVFYSLGNHVMDIHIPVSEWRQNPQLGKLVDTYGIRIDDFGRGDYATYPFASDARMTAIAQFRIADGELSKTSILPAYIQPDGSPNVLGRNDPHAQELYEYLSKVTLEAGLRAGFQWSANEILVLPK